MKFGKQLELGVYVPWQEYYIQYSRLKRILRRNAFLAGKTVNDDSDNELELLEIPTEATPLKKTESNVEQSADYEDFFAILDLEILKVNKFAVGKVAELRLLLDGILEKRDNAYRSHHTDGERHQLITLKDVYVQLIALKKFCLLNSTGFSKIVKKYDKVMNTSVLPTWKIRIQSEFFASTDEPLKMINSISGIVSRDKLIEWERSGLALYSDGGSKGGIFVAIKPAGLVISVVIFTVSYLLSAASDPVAGRGLALLLFVISLWITEAMPYFATGLLIPVLVTLLNVLTDGEGNVLSAEASSAFVMSHMFNHTTVLILGGYTISSAFSRCQLELLIASKMQQWFGSSPRLFILAMMLLGLFLSMWISNHTAPILCTAIILPIIRDLPTDSKFTKALLLGLAFGCNFGGLMTPIASLQNVIAVSQLQEIGVELSFMRWMIVAVPFGLIGTLLAWMVIIFFVDPNDVKRIPVVVVEKTENNFETRNNVVIIVTVIVCFTFAIFSQIKGLFGDIGIISLIYIAAMFGTGLLSEVDFNSLSWHTLMLLGGGSVLGKAVESSGLLKYLSGGIVQVLPLAHPWVALVIILFFVGIVASFISHTVAALIILPVVTHVGVEMNMPAVVGIAASFAVSSAMALPFSSFPNVNSLLIVDDFRRSYLCSNDFLLVGIPMTVLSLLLIATFGYLLIETFVV